MMGAAAADTTTPFPRLQCWLLLLSCCSCFNIDPIQSFNIVYFTKTNRKPGIGGTSSSSSSDLLLVAPRRATTTTTRARAPTIASSSRRQRRPLSTTKATTAITRTATQLFQNVDTENNNNINNDYDEEYDDDDIKALAETLSLTHGHAKAFLALEKMNITLPLGSKGEQQQYMPMAPQLTYSKYLTMQEKRVVVTIRYSEDSGLRPYFLTIAKKLKDAHPDILIERRILPASHDGNGNNNGGGGGNNNDDGIIVSSDATFEVLVDGRVVVGKQGGKAARTKAKVARVDMKKTKSIFVSMTEIDHAISRARRRRRPNTTYGAANNHNHNMKNRDSSLSLGGVANGGNQR